MTKYKLIKTYPGSHPKGAVSKCDYSNYPEFWEKVEELDYEIMNYRDYNGNISDYQKSGSAINSVKRLSDGEVFTIGDEIRLNNYGTMIIEKMTLTDSNSRIKQGVWFNYEGGSCHSDIAVKIKTPLFTTEDGVAIFEGDDFSVVQLKTFQIINECKYPLTNPLNWACFSSEEKAQEYVLLNKPMLSLQDLLNVWGVSDEIGAYKTSLMFNKFEKLAKSKL